MSRVGVLLNAFQYPINSGTCFPGNGVGDNEMGMVVEERYLTLRISVDRVLKRIRHTRPLFTYSSTTVKWTVESQSIYNAMELLVHFCHAG